MMMMNEQQDFTEAKSLAGFQETLPGQVHPELAGYVLKEFSGILEGIGIVSLGQTSLGFDMNPVILTAFLKNSCMSRW